MFYVSTKKYRKIIALAVFLFSMSLFYEIDQASCSPEKVSMQVSIEKNWKFGFPLWIAVKIKNQQKSKTLKAFGKSLGGPFHVNGYYLRIYPVDKKTDTRAENAIIEKMHKIPSESPGLVRDADGNVVSNPWPLHTISPGETKRFLFPEEFSQHITPGEYELEIALLDRSSDVRSKKLKGVTRMNVKVPSKRDQSALNVLKSRVTDGEKLADRVIFTKKIEIPDSIAQQFRFEKLLNHLIHDKQKITDNHSVDRIADTVPNFFLPVVRTLQYEISKRRGAKEKVKKFHKQIKDQFPGMLYRIRLVNEGKGVLKTLKQMDKALDY